MNSPSNKNQNEDWVDRWSRKVADAVQKAWPPTRDAAIFFYKETARIIRLAWPPTRDWTKYWTRRIVIVTKRWWKRPTFVSGWQDIRERLRRWHGEKQKEQDERLKRWREEDTRRREEFQKQQSERPQIPKPNSGDPSFRPLLGLGILCVVVGACVSYYFLVQYDATNYGTYNVGLLQNRLLGSIAGMITAALGAIMLVIDNVMAGKDK